LAQGRNCVAALPDDVRWHLLEIENAGSDSNYGIGKPSGALLVREYPNPKPAGGPEISFRCYIEPAREEGASIERTWYREDASISNCTRSAT
jgi:hypothetical protein